MSVLPTEADLDFDFDIFFPDPEDYAHFKRSYEISRIDPVLVSTLRCHIERRLIFASVLTGISIGAAIIACGNAIVNLLG